MIKRLHIYKERSDSPANYGIAWHNGSGGIRLGTGWTPDTSFGDGDDDVSGDDGVTRSGPWITNGTATIYANIVGSGSNPFLAGWVDWNGDGDFNDANEQVHNDGVTIGNHEVVVTIPATYVTGTTVRARWRVYESPPLMLAATPDGEATSGEVEDYDWHFGPTAVELIQLTARTPDYSRLFWLAPALILLVAAGWWLRRRRMQQM